MKYDVIKMKQFKKSLKRMLRRGKDIDNINDVISKLANGEVLPPKYKDHPLHGDLEGFRDCHIENDWVLLYYIEDAILVLTLVDTETHADLF